MSWVFDSKLIFFFSEGASTTAWFKAYVSTEARDKRQPWDINNVQSVLVLPAISEFAGAEELHGLLSPRTLFTSAEEVFIYSGVSGFALRASFKIFIMS